MERLRSVHVMVLTYPAQGHINPLLQFTKQLASKGVQATLATTYYTASAIRATGVNVEPISDGFDQGGFKQALSLEAYLESFKANGSKSLTELILKFRNLGKPVDCLVYDSLIPWAFDVAKERGIYKAAFLTNSASVCSLYWYIRQGVLSLPLKYEDFPMVLPGLPELQLSDLPSFIVNPLQFSEYLGLIMEQFSALEQNDWVFINTFAQLESQIDKEMSGKWPLVMIGPMLPSAFVDSQVQDDKDYGGSLWGQSTEHCMRWLDSKATNSVIYISFGSMAEIPHKQVEELAWGLLNTQRPFLLVSRDSEKDELKSLFTSIGSEAGLVVPWCNQLEVLAHRATGCFITHCGWNSTLEGLCLGVPMMGLPQWSDQPLNAKMIEAVWKVGVGAKTNSEGIVSREEIERSVSKIMAGSASVEFKKNSCHWREAAVDAISKGGSSNLNVDKFLETLQKVDPRN